MRLSLGPVARLPLRAMPGPHWTIDGRCMPLPDEKKAPKSRTIALGAADGGGAIDGFINAVMPQDRALRTTLMFAAPAVAASVIVLFVPLLTYIQEEVNFCFAIRSAQMKKRPPKLSRTRAELSKRIPEQLHVQLFEASHLRNRRTEAEMDTKMPADQKRYWRETAHNAKVEYERLKGRARQLGVSCCNYTGSRETSMPTIELAPNE
jgi:hypothetical protein